MPNWCDNHLTIEGRDLFPFIQWLGNSPISLERVLPIPEDIECSPEEWCTDNWGTKWDVEEARTQPPILVTPTKIESDFETAWGPPIKALEALSGKFPDLKITLYFMETSSGFAGHSVFRSGGECMEEMLSFSEYSAPEDYKSLARICRTELKKLQVRRENRAKLVI
jgi:hypothetical protein